MLNKPTPFAFYALCHFRSRGDLVHALELSKRYGTYPQIADQFKSLVEPGATNDPAWASPLAAISSLTAEFTALLRPATILGRLAGVREVPFQTKFPLQTAGTAVRWVGEKRPAPVGELAYQEAMLTHSKISGVVVISDQLAMSSDPAAVRLVEADLVAATAQFTDEQFIDPSVAEVTDVSPASVTHGAPTFESTGDTADNVEADLKLLVASLNDAGVRFIAPYFVLRPNTALHLASLRDVAAGGQRLFPGMGVKGGEIWGIPVIVSANVPLTNDSTPLTSIVLLDASELLVADGGLDLDSSRQASLQMRNDPVTGAQQMVSMWQTGCVGARVNRFIRWRARRPEAIAVLSHVTY